MWRVLNRNDFVLTFGNFIDILKFFKYFETLYGPCICLIVLLVDIYCLIDVVVSL